MPISLNWETCLSNKQTWANQLICKSNLIKLCWISPVVAEKIFKCCQCNHFAIISPLLKHNWIPFTYGYVVPSLVEICSLVQEKQVFLNAVSSLYINLQFHNYLPKGKDVALYLNKLIPFTSKCYFWFKIKSETYKTWNNKMLFFVIVSAS